MTKLSSEVKEAILKDKSNMTTKQLQDKYGLSRSSIQRVKGGELDSRASEFLSEAPPPEPTPKAEQKKSEFADNFVKTILKDDAKQIVEIPVIDTPKREHLIQKILLNADTFPAHFPFITDRTSFMNSLSDKSTSALDDLLTTMEKTRSVNNFAAQLKQVFFVSTRAVETLGTRIKLKTTGLTSAIIQQQQELDYIFKELAIQYGDSFNRAAKPEVRLAMVFGMTLLQVDAQNRLRDAMQQQPPEEKYGDL